jgi:MFS family permease
VTSARAAPTDAGAVTHLFGGRLPAVSLLLAMFTEAVGYGMVAPTLPFMARRAGAGEGGVGLLVGVYAAVGLVASVPMGALATRYGRRSLVILGLALLTAASIGFVFAPTYGWLVAARVLQGLGALGVWVGAITMAADLSESQSMGRSLSWLTGTWSLGFIAGPALGGLGSLQVPFILYAALSAATLLLAIAGLPDVGRGEPRATFGGIVQILKRRAILASGAATFGLAFFYGTIEAFLPLFLAAEHGRGQVGLLFSIAGIPSVVLPVVAGRLADRHGDARLIVFGFLFAAALCVAFLPLYGRLPHAVLFFLLGCVEVLVYVPAVALLHRGTETSDRAIASASHSYAFSCGFCLGPFLAGALFPFGGWRTMFGLLTAVVVAASIVVARVAGGDRAPQPLAGDTAAY